ncbi:hypothetical protein [Meiothermus hypogaeus]|uniref:Peptidase MA-like domain-containing protein n=2 Tax=Meiothermus hypogaeus TaxID=884155 RepID=A0A511QXG1_9DEIN|nr:hypothetical protein [Meiothermus hypogaeus]RIH80672.1 hypothetical protein Mhypo_00388 [Meiothermus hypogaeus]GEM82069.1 hypothetical protein MHY01S_02350 [Meiothermus hypogaeus NBRC 106114]
MHPRFSQTLFFFPYLLVLALAFISPAGAQAWKSAQAPGFVVRWAQNADTRHLSEVFRVLQKARRDLQTAGYSLPPQVRVVIHPSLASYTASTRLPWFVLAAANRSTHQIDTQRLRILLERGTLEGTLRHELFHLAQPAGWPRWKAEGMALRFAGEEPTARPLEPITEAELERLLAAPPDRETLRRAMATAYRWTSRLRR